MEGRLPLPDIVSVLSRDRYESSSAKNTYSYSFLNLYRHQHVNCKIYIYRFFLLHYIQNQHRAFGAVFTHAHQKCRHCRLPSHARHLSFSSMVLQQAVQYHTGLFLASASTTCKADHAAESQYCRKLVDTHICVQCSCRCNSPLDVTRDDTC